MPNRDYVFAEIKGEMPSYDLDDIHYIVVRNVADEAQAFQKLPNGEFMGLIISGVDLDVSAMPGTYEEI